ncbi:MAG: Polysaccharide biosynthesis protein [Microgenomates bacterium OLB23]|nr:MAG: Polysaccharide biosynthesis protein [Microgenomates bacterium OLB23]
MKVFFYSLHNKFVKGGFILTAATVATGLLNYVSNSLTAKALGPQGVGELFALFAYLAIAGIPFTIITTVIIKKLGEAHTNRLHVAQKIESWFILHVIYNKKLMLILLLCSLTLPYITKLSTASSITLILLTAIGLPSTMYLGLLQGMHLFSAFTLGVFLVAISRLIGALSVYMHIGNLQWIYVSLIIGAFMPIIVGKKLLPKTRIVINTQHGLTKILMKPTVVLTSLSMTGVIMFNNIDVAFVKRFYEPEMVGLYGSWSLLGKLLGYVVAPINIVTLIFFSAQETKAQQRKVLFFMAAALTLSGMVMGMLYVQYPHQVIDFVFSSSFYAIEPYLGHAAFFGMSYSIATLINNYFISKGDKKSLGILFFY